MSSVFRIHQHPASPSTATAFTEPPPPALDPCALLWVTAGDLPTSPIPRLLCSKFSISFHLTQVNLQSLQRLTRPLGPASAHHLTPVHSRHLTPGVLLFLDQIHTFPPQGLWMCWSPFQEHCPSRYMHSSPSGRSMSGSYHPLVSLNQSPPLYPLILLIL